jgi:3-deoxy-7-phosphoheptulonate synthase
VLGELARLPPIVVSWEVDQLKEELAAAQRGDRFLLQGGDCAEDSRLRIRHHRPQAEDPAA